MLELLRARALLAVALALTGASDEAWAGARAVTQEATKLGLGAVVRQSAALLPELFAAARRPDQETAALCFPTTVRLAESGETRAAGAAPPAPYPAVAAFALRELRVTVDGDPVPDSAWRREKARELLFFLLTREGPVAEETILAALWPERDRRSARASLRAAVYRLRQALYRDCILNRRGAYELDPAATFWFDVAEFRRLAVTPAASPDFRVALQWEEALELYGGPPAPELGDWAEPLRADLEQRHLVLLVELARYEQGAGRAGRAAEFANRALRVDPLCEAAAAIRFEAMLAAGDRAAARRTFLGFSRALDTDGLEPSPQFVQRYREALSSRRSRQ